MVRGVLSHRSVYHVTDSLYLTGSGAATNTFYTDSSCTIPNGASSVFQLNDGCYINGGSSYDSDAYMVITACGSSNPYVNYPDNMPTES